MQRKEPQCARPSLDTYQYCSVRITVKKSSLGQFLRSIVFYISFGCTDLESFPGVDPQDLSETVKQITSVSSEPGMEAELTTADA